MKNNQEWQELTPALLQELELNGGTYWIAARDYPRALVGEYQWQQGRDPYGFNDEQGRRYFASNVTHIMKYNPPTPPTNIKE